MHNQAGPRRLHRNELRAENHRLHQVKSTSVLKHFTFHTNHFQVRCVEEKRIRSCANLVPAISRRRHAIGPGADHHVQTARANGYPEQGSWLRWKLVSDRENRSEMF